MAERLSTLTAEREPTLKELQAELADARSEWAKLSSKRQRRAADYKRIHGYNAAKARYDQLSIECAKRELADTLANTTDETQRKLVVAQHWLQEQNTLREATKQTTEGKRRWKFANKFSKWMNEGTRGQRIAKGLGVGMAAGIFGGIAGTAAGAVVIGTSVAAAARFGKGYLMRHSEGIGQTNASADDMAASLEGADSDNSELIDRMHAVSSDMYEQDSKHEQRKIKTAVKWGLGTVAVGGALGYALNGLAGLAPAAHAETLPSTDHSPVGIDPQHDTVGVEAGNEHRTIGLDTTQHEQIGISGDSYGLIGLDTEQHTTIGVEQTEVEHQNVDPEPDTAHSVVDVEDTNAHDAISVEDDDHGTIGVEQSEDNHGTVSVETDDNHAPVDVDNVANDHAPVSVEPQAEHDTVGVDADGNNNGHDTVGIDGDGDTTTHEIVPLDNGGYESETSEPGHEVVGLDDGGHEPAPDHGVDTTDAFTVEHGNGYTHELIDAAAANGVEMTGEQAWLAHQAIVDAAGADYIDLADHAGPDTYSMGDTSYETGISAPSEAATWSADAQPLVADAIDDGVINGSVVDDMHDVVPLDEADATLSESDWNEIDAMLQEAVSENAFENVGPEGQVFLNELGPELKDIMYADGTDIMTFDGSNWHVNDSDSLLPQSAFDAIHAYLEENDAALENAQKFAEVIQ